MPCRCAGTWRWARPNCGRGSWSSRTCAATAAIVPRRPRRRHREGARAMSFGRALFGMVVVLSLASGMAAGALTEPNGGAMATVADCDRYRDLATSCQPREPDITGRIWCPSYWCEAPGNQGARCVVEAIRGHSGHSPANTHHRDLVVAVVRRGAAPVLHLQWCIQCKWAGPNGVLLLRPTMRIAIGGASVARSVPVEQCSGGDGGRASDRK